MDRVKKDLCTCYAKVLYGLGSSAELVLTFDVLLQEIEAISNCITHCEGFFPFVKSRHNSVKEKLELVKTLTKDCSKLMKNFLCVLIANNRGGLIQSIFEEFQKLHKKNSGEMNVLVRSYHSLQSNEEKEIIKALEPSYGSKLNIKNTVDKSTLGGRIILVNHTLYDFSLRSVLSGIANASKQAIRVFEGEEK